MATMMPVPTIYIVDDDEAVRDSLSMLLGSYGLRVASFASTADFARAYKPHGNDCLILDHHLPGTTGLDFLASHTLKLPVILITGGVSQVIRDRAVALGVSAFFEKPVTAQPLLAAISSALGRQPAA